MTLTDGRVLVGLLQCVDKQGNLVLHSTREYRPARCADDVVYAAKAAAGHLRPLSHAHTRMPRCSGSERAVGLVLVLRQDWVGAEAHEAVAKDLLTPR